MTTPDLDVPHAFQPFEDVCCAGQPDEQCLQQARDKGYRTVVNLRTAGEVTDWDPEAVCRDLGLEYVHIPISGPDDLTEENARRLDEAISDDSARPALVHCGTSNRVGALFAIRAAWLQGVDPESALELGRDAGLTKLEDAVRAKLGLT